MVVSVKKSENIEFLNYNLTLGEKWNNIVDNKGKEIKYWKKRGFLIETLDVFKMKYYVLVDILKRFNRNILCVLFISHEELYIKA